MKAAQRLPTILALAALAGAFFFALDRYAAAGATHDAMQSALDGIADCERMAKSHPGAFGKGGTPIDVALKPLVQEASARQSINLSYLSEIEKDVEGGARERSVYARAANVPHDRLVALLCELEARGGGAKIKEINLTISKENGGVYAEVNTVLSKRVLKAEEKR
jgi:hypothetical protein